MKPQIVREGLQKISTIKVGRNHTFDVEVIGEPITTKLWFKEEATVPIENDEKLNIENEDYSTKFSFTKAQRRVGSYSICRDLISIGFCRKCLKVGNYPES